MTRFNISLPDELIVQLDSERGGVKRSTTIAIILKYILSNKDFVKTLVNNTHETNHADTQD